MDYKASEHIQDLQYFGEFGGVNPSISDSSTYTFLSAKTMFDTFEGNTEGCYLYSRHSSPSNLYLGEAMAQLEGTESANVFASGMGAISAVVFQLCDTDDHIVCSRTIYGGTYAFLKNFVKKFNISTSFIDITDLDMVEQSITPKTKMIYCEAISNPLLEVADIAALSKLAKKHGIPLVVDNTFSPLNINAAQLGADIVIHSLTKFINGSSDCVAGAVCASSDFCLSLKDVNNGAGMLMGSTLDSLRAASILKNMRTLHIRIKKHSENALYLAQQFEKDGLKVVYPGLESHPGHKLMKSQMNPEYGFGGLLTLDVGSVDQANALMELMQTQKLGYLAVSLGFYKTLFSASGSSTSSEIPMEEQEALGLSQGLIRFSIGLDNNIHQTYLAMRSCMEKLGILNLSPSAID
ncbi:aminotransferase class I/II-fold pyridoxal phosphate-dependent enzyme [Flagellimonas alvinocaridis]|uniref:Aminotransferase class I/II-fold pyridoxal phosphate-dependent enzyme n=1 Tax=Flagellimonas alvinocaridis TaxID=2530200 RepID=A0A4S8RJU8_9FLAO|nr:aminotransferase class I/II-fold pyridoxal phosphate-dependent enzyme [Allomuricauda alvinocaridis]THV58260.1 aminotransferase class I/II-fold pyridoxal phosphate-dependent enzyme [Allomuricauda alvinocaridis]